MKRLGQVLRDWTLRAKNAVVPVPAVALTSWELRWREDIEMAELRLEVDASGDYVVMFIDHDGREYWLSGRASGHGFEATICRTPEELRGRILVRRVGHGGHILPFELGYDPMIDLCAVA